MLKILVILLKTTAATLSFYGIKLHFSKISRLCFQKLFFIILVGFCYKNHLWFSVNYWQFNLISFTWVCFYNRNYDVWNEYDKSIWLKWIVYTVSEAVCFSCALELECLDFPCLYLEPDYTNKKLDKAFWLEKF